MISVAWGVVLVLLALVDVVAVVAFVDRYSWHVRGPRGDLDVSSTLYALLLLEAGVMLYYGVELLLGEGG